jgi:hypothetical protein
MPKRESPSTGNSASQRASADVKAKTLGYAFEPLLSELNSELQAIGEAAPTQDGAVQMLVAVGRFLDAVSNAEGAAGSAALMCMSLAAQIQDLAQGNVGLLLRPAAKGAGRRPMPISDQFIVVAAALAMDAEMRSGRGRNEAAARVAWILDSIGVRMGIGGTRAIEAKTVAKWREELQQGPKASGSWSIAEARWRMVQDRINAGGELAPNAGERWLRSLPAHLRAMGIFPDKPRD